MMVGYIYKITNKINNKMYIGKTVNSIEERWKEHQRSYWRFPERPLYRAINKYGIENFTIELVEEVPINKLSEQEIYWIGYFHTYTEGYNATFGGDGKILYDYDLIADLIQNQYTSTQITQELGCCKDVIYLVAKKNNLQIAKPTTDCMRAKQPVKQYDKENNYIQSFESYAEAARWLKENGYVSNNLGGVRSHIGEVCQGKRKTAYGFIWKKDEI